MKDFKDNGKSQSMYNVCICICEGAPKIIWPTKKTRNFRKNSFSAGPAILQLI